MWPMGTASSARPGNRPIHISRETSPCSADTALARRESLSPSTVMQNISCGLPGFSRPSAISRFVRESQRFAKRAQVLFHQSRVEPVVAGGHRRVGGEHHFASHAARRRSKLRPSSSMRQRMASSTANAAVAFVHVQHPGGDPHGPQRAIAADAQQQFLPDAHAPVAAVEPRSQLAVLRRVAVHVGVEQQKVAAPHLHAPDFGEDRPAAGLDLDRDRFAFGADRRLHRHLRDVRPGCSPPAASRCGRGAGGNNPVRRTSRSRPAECPGRMRS